MPITVARPQPERPERHPDHDQHDDRDGDRDQAHRLRAQHQPLHLPPHRHVHQQARLRDRGRCGVGPLLGPHLGAVVQQDLTHPVRLGQRQVGQRDLRVGGRGLDLQLGQAEQPGDEGLLDPDLEDPVEAHPSRSPADHAGVDAQLAGVDAEERAVPRGEAEDPAEHQDAEHGDRKPLQPTLLKHLAPPGVRRHDQEDPGARHRGQRRESAQLTRRPVGRRVRDRSGSCAGTGGSLTARPTRPRRPRSAGPAAGRPPRAAARGSSRRSRRTRCAARPRPGRSGAPAARP